MKHILYKVYSVREYDKDYIGQQGTFVRIDQLLCDGEECKELDSTVYSMETFKDIHGIYRNLHGMSNFINGDKAAFIYNYSVYTDYVNNIVRELKEMS